MHQAIECIVDGPSLSQCRPRITTGPYLMVLNGIGVLQKSKTPHFWV